MRRLALVLSISCASPPPPAPIEIPAAATPPPRPTTPSATPTATPTTSASATSIASSTPAPSPSPADLAHARALFQLGVTAYESGDYALALTNFEQAFALARTPVLLHNLARTHERLGNDTEAAARYEQYLQERPNAPDRAEVEARIKKLRAKP